MKKLSSLPFFLMGLSVLSPMSYASSPLSGSLRLDSAFNTELKDANSASVSDGYKPQDNFYISRYRLDFKGHIAKNWSYHLRLANDEYTNAQQGFYGLSSATLRTPSGTMTSPLAAHTPFITQAYAEWTQLNKLKISVGRIEATNISSDNDYYKPYIGTWTTDRAIGTLIQTMGDHAGLKIEGSWGPFGASSSVWNQTSYQALKQFGTLSSATMLAAATVDIDFLDEFSFGQLPNISNSGSESFAAKNIRLGYGSRLSITPKISNSFDLGLGFGYSSAPFYIPIVVTVVEGGVLGSASSTPASLVTLINENLVANNIIDFTETKTSFNNLQQFTLDASAVYGPLQVNAGYQDIKFKKDVTAQHTASVTGSSTVTSPLTPASSIFDRNGKATSFWVEAGYLLMGERYEFDAAKSLVSHVKTRNDQSALEISARFGQETRQNVIALMTEVGYDDFNSRNIGKDLIVDGFKLVNQALNQNTYVFTIDNNATDAQQAATGTDLTEPAVHPIVISGENGAAYQTRTQGYLINLNYYLNDSVTFKAQYESKTNKFMRSSNPTLWQNSINHYKVSSLKFRAEFLI